VTLGDHARRQAKAKAQSQIDVASRDFQRGKLSDVAWASRVAEALATAYLGDEDPRWQSGFDGDAELWREARELILDAIPGDGTLLDIGCATGHLIESLASWSLERGLRLMLFGLELNPKLAAMARVRLPTWSDRIFDGNAIDWQPPSILRMSARVWSMCLPAGAPL
jgi:hypothetical protein